jgi:hypothetical protein
MRIFYVHNWRISPVLGAATAAATDVTLSDQQSDPDEVILA